MPVDAVILSAAIPALCLVFLGLGYWVGREKRHEEQVKDVMSFALARHRNSLFAPAAEQEKKTEKDGISKVYALPGDYTA